jgi:hypothetical protein
VNFGEHIDLILTGIVTAIPSFLLGRKKRQIDNLDKGMILYRSLLDDLEKRYNSRINECKEDCQRAITALENRIKKIEKK